MILKNPLAEDVSIAYLGETFTIPANETLDVSDEVGAHWKNIHGFLIVESAPVKAAKAPKIEEVEAPVAPTASTKKTK